METLVSNLQSKKPQTDPTSLKNIIRDLGLKVTQQRLLVLECLLKGRDHITAQELFESVVSIDDRLGFATVYRFLRQLTNAGFVTEVRMGGLPARYEWVSKKSHHDHLTCSQCGKICEFENENIERLQEEVVKSFGFIMTGHVLELYGICPDCQSDKGILPGSNLSS